MGRWVVGALLVTFVLATACASFPAGAAITGIVVDVDGKPLADVRVILQRASTDPRAGGSDELVRTDASGTFSVRAVPGKSQLLLTHPTLGWMIVQDTRPGRALRVVFDGRTRVIRRHSDSRRDVSPRGRDD